MAGQDKKSKILAAKGELALWTSRLMSAFSEAEPEYKISECEGQIRGIEKRIKELQKLGPFLSSLIPEESKKDFSKDSAGGDEIGDDVQTET